MSESYLHESPSDLSATTLDHHRAYRSLMEEIEAIDWYAQRIDATADAELKAVLAHNRREEKEHAAMVLEWLRRRDATLDHELRAYLFTEGPIAALEEGSHEGAPAPASDGSLGIGSLKGRSSR